MAKIKASPGTDEANFGTDRFPVPADGIIDVSNEAAEALVHDGGFTRVVDAVPVPDGLVRVQGVPGSGCSIGGASYEADDEGFVDVPAYAVADLAAHGFVPVAD